MLFRPFRVGEAWWAAGGAVALVIAGALSPPQALRAFARGADVYLFLAGMMALAEFARSEGVFAWIAAKTVHAARGSQQRLFAFVFVAGVVTTAFLSNDATVVLLTPAVLAALAGTRTPVEPYAFACAFVANAASTALPIANPSNLLFFADGMPALGTWLVQFGPATLAALVLTYAALTIAFRAPLRAPLEAREGSVPAPRRAALAMLACAAAALVAVAARGGPLGVTAFCLALCALALAATRDARAPLDVARGVAWPVVVLTAGLFVIVAALDSAGAASLPHALFAWAVQQNAWVARLGVAFAAAAASNIANNLPVGLALGAHVGSAHPPAALSAAALVGVNVGPNFSANGSLATVLWLALLRRAGIRVSPLRFAAIGLMTAPLALAAAALLAM